MTSSTSIDLNFDTKEIVILGTQYAGEMKKAIFSVMNYIMPFKANFLFIQVVMFHLKEIIPVYFLV